MRYSINHRRLRRVTDKVLSDIQTRVNAAMPTLRKVEADAQWARDPGMRPLPEDEDTRPIRVPHLARGTQNRAPIDISTRAGGRAVVPVNGPLECLCGEPKNFWEAHCALCE